MVSTIAMIFTIVKIQIFIEFYSVRIAAQLFKAAIAIIIELKSEKNGTNIYWKRFICQICLNPLSKSSQQPYKGKWCLCFTDGKKCPQS